MEQIFRGRQRWEGAGKVGHDGWQEHELDLGVGKRSDHLVTAGGSSAVCEVKEFANQPPRSPRSRSPHSCARSANTGAKPPTTSAGSTCRFWYDNNRLIRLTGRDWMSDEDGNDYLNSRDGEVDTVRCADIGDEYVMDANEDRLGCSFTSRDQTERSER